MREVWSVLARHATLLAEEVDDLLDLLLGRVLEFWDKRHSLVVGARHQVPHEHVVLLANYFAHLFVIAAACLVINGEFWSLTL